MNKTKTKIAFGIGIVALLAVLSVSTASANVTVYFVPQDSSVPEGEGYSAYVEVWLSTEDPDTALSGQFAIHYDPSCVNITEHPVYGEDAGWGECIMSTMSSWNANPNCHGDGYDMVMYTFIKTVPHAWCPSPQKIANFTVQCTSSEYCVSNLSVSCGRVCSLCPIQILDGSDINLYPDNTTFVDGTFECGELPPPETFEKGLVSGWNLISLPLTNDTDMTVANIMDTSLSGSYDSLYKYDASTHSFVALSSEDTMENGVGYFINMTSADMWTYSGSAYTPMNVGLSQGLNMVGWLNCSKSISGNLTSIDGNYYYIARWNATSQSYETYNPAAPSAFNDFTTMDRGEGYFISAKGVDTLSESC